MTITERRGLRSAEHQPDGLPLAKRDLPTAKVDAESRPPGGTGAGYLYLD